MDSLDVRVCRELFHSRTGPLDSDFRRSYRSIARKLRIDEVTIRNRIKRFQQSGFLKGWRLIVNPNLLGVKLTQLWFDVRPPSAKDDLVRKLRLIHGALAISDYHGSWMTLIIMYESEGSAKKEFELIARISNAENLVCASIPFPGCTIDLTPTDWRIIKAIQGNPRQSYSVVSREVGISQKTVRRRLQRMIEERALFAVPSWNPQALDGAIMADLIVFYANPESKADLDNRIVSHFDKFLIWTRLSSIDHGFFNLIIGNISKAKEILTWVKEQPGVGSAFVELVQDRIEVYESFNEPVEKKLAEASISIRAS
ncbi:MAG: AsnC family transcriptional regulator [Thaumarchaeota archaeon]|nr:MAG: AsnC family transcriptional regulator [Nitrososphaerota archaeon]